MKHLHATQIATRGIISTYGLALASAGFIVKIEEIPVEPISPGYGLGGGGSVPTIDPKKKCIRVTVLYKGKKFVTEHCIDKNHSISLRDIEVKHDDERIIEVIVKNIRKS